MVKAKLKVNRYKIAKDTGINLAHVSRIFSRQSTPSFKTACDIADSMGCSLDDLADLLKIREGERPYLPKPKSAKTAK